MRDKEIISSEEELIQYLKDHLAEQRKEYKDKYNSIEIPDSELILSVSDMEIDFEFNFRDILRAVGVTEQDENNKLICPYRIDFNYTTFSKKVDFYNIAFIGIVFFWDTTFNQDITFRYTTFEQDLIFQEIIFNRKALFLNIKFKQTIEFNGITMNMDINNLIFNNIYSDNLIRKHFYTPKDSTIAITNTVINGRIDFNYVHIAKLDLQGSNVTGILNRINLKAKSKNWETACILKNEELKRNNTKQALEYHAEEKDLHRKDSWKNHKYGEWLSLLLSKIVNNHGQSWFQAFCFTLVVWILCFSIFYLPNPCKYWYYWVYLFEKGIYTAELFQYFVPTNYDQIIEYVKISELDLPIKFGGVLAYILGKIFVPYGIFEIIKAFRKYR